MGRKEQRPLTQEDIAQALADWQRHQSAVWYAFRKSLSPEQEQLLREYHYAARIIANLRKWQNRIRQGYPIRQEIPQPRLRVKEEAEDAPMPIFSLAVKLGGYPMPGFTEAALNALNDLEDQERAVLEHLCGFPDGRPRTPEETAQALGLPRERIRRIEARALEKLRERLERYLLPETAFAVESSYD